MFCQRLRMAYSYISKREGGGTAAYQIHEEHAAVVKQIFEWVGRDRISIGEAKRRLDAQEVPSPSGKTWWDRTTIWGMLKNPAYKGSAAFGKTRTGPRRKQPVTQRGHSKTPRRTGSTYDTSPDQQISIPVPAIVSEEMFATVEQQLTKKLSAGTRTKTWCNLPAARSAQMRVLRLRLLRQEGEP